MSTHAGPVLMIEELHVRYGQLAALRGASLHVDEGEVVCVIGPNGAGKTTLLTAVAGGIPVARGDIRLRGERIAGRAPERIARAGLTLVPEGRRIFGTLTVDENLRLAAYNRAAKGGADADRERVLTYFPRLRERLASPAGQLSGGEQQMLAVGRALMTRASVIMVDEPSLGLAPRIIDQIYDILLEMRRRERLTLLINEQSSQRILKHADRIYVLRGGRIRLHGRAEDLRDGDAIRDAYFGFGRDQHQQKGGAAA